MVPITIAYKNYSDKNKKFAKVYYISFYCHNKNYCIYLYKGILSLLFIYFTSLEDKNTDKILINKGYFEVLWKAIHSNFILCIFYCYKNL